MSDIAPYTCLIIGLGQIGMGYDLELDSSKFVFTHARAFNQHPCFSIIGAVEPNKEKQDLFTSVYSCPVYSSIDIALEQHSPQVIIIAVSTEDHLLAIESVLDNSNPIAILCEKPLSTDLETAEQIVNRCKKKSVQLFVNYMRLSEPGVIEIKRRIEVSEITTPAKAIVWYSKGFIHNGSHFFNLFEYWFGKCKDYNVIEKGLKINEFDSEPQVLVNFEKGQVNFIPAWEKYFSFNTVELLSPSGRLYLSTASELLWQSTKKNSNLKNYNQLTDKVESISVDMNKYQWHVAEQLRLVLEGKPASLCRGDDALITIKTMFQIIKQG